MSSINSNFINSNLFLLVSLLSECTTSIPQRCTYVRFVLAGLGRVIGLLHDHHSLVLLEFDKVFRFGDGAEKFMGLLYNWSIFGKTFNIGGFAGNVGTAFIFFNFVFLEDLFELEHLAHHVISIAPGIKLVGVFGAVLSVSLVSTIVVVKSISVIVSVRS